MPPVTQQKPEPKKAAPSPPPLPPPEIQQEGMKFLLWGHPKVGKTRLIATFPRPILFVGQDGTKSIATGKRVKPRAVLPGGTPVRVLMRGNEDAQMDLVVLQNASDFDEALAWGVEQKYQTICLDTILELQMLQVKRIAGMSETPQSLSFGIINREQWGQVGQLVIGQLFNLFNLTETHGIHAAVLGHPKNFKEQDDNKNAALISPEMSVDSTKAVKNWLNRSCDYICQMEIAEEVVTVEQDTGVEGQTEKVRTPTGKFEYRLAIGRHAVYTRGFRSMVDDLPDYIVNPTFEKIQKVILGQKL